MFCHVQHPRLVGVLALYTGDRELAQDLAQETLARLWRDWRRLRRSDSPEAYAYRTAINLAKNQFRRRATGRKYRHRLAGEPSATGVDPDQAEAVTVRSAVAALPARKRTALVLRYYADRSVAETARIMGVPQNTVKTLTRRALADLRGDLSPAQEEDVRCPLT